MKSIPSINSYFRQGYWTVTFAASFQTIYIEATVPITENAITLCQQGIEDLITRLQKSSFLYAYINVQCRFAHIEILLDILLSIQPDILIKLYTSVPDKSDNQPFADTLESLFSGFPFIDSTYMGI